MFTRGKCIFMSVVVLTAVISLTPLATAADDVGYFWHLTDFHYDTNFTVEPSNARNDSEFYDGSYDYTTCWVEGGGQFGDYNCDSPFRLVMSAIRFVATYTSDNLNNGGERPFVMWTGDDTSHAEDEYFGSLTKVLETVDILTSAISELNLVVFPVMGNHDSHPKSQYPDDPQDDLYQLTGDIWKNWLESYDAYQQFKDNGGFYSISRDITGLPFNLVGLNTNLYYNSNNLISEEDTEDPMGQFQWLEDQLQQYRQSGETAVLFAHIGPGMFERFYGNYDEDYFGWYWFKPDFNRRYLDIVEEYADVIGGQFYGHQHCDSLRTFGTSWALLAPSVTPWRSTLAPETGANNPGVRLVKFDKGTGEILDYDQFYLNLAAANTAGTAEWTKLYSLKDYYGLSDISAASISALIEEIGSNEQTFSKYYLANTVAYEEYSESVCDVDCKRYHYCAMAKQDYGMFNDCIAEHFGWNITTTTTSAGDASTTTSAEDTSTTTSAGEIICSSFIVSLLLLVNYCLFLIN